MSTKITTKKYLLDFLSRLEDDDIILLTNDLDGEIAFKKKTNSKRVSFGFSADAFKESKGIGDIYFGKIPLWSFAILKKEEASDDVIKIHSELK